MIGLNKYIIEKLKINKETKLLNEFDNLVEDAIKQITDYFSPEYKPIFTVARHSVTGKYILRITFNDFPTRLNVTAGENDFFDYIENCYSDTTTNTIVKDIMDDVYICPNKWIAIILNYDKKVTSSEFLK